MAGIRRRFTPEQKVEILREHLKNKVAISDLCRKYDIHPNLFYRWEKETFEGWISILSGEHRRHQGALRARESKLRAKIQKLEEVIAWLTRENIDLKKAMGTFLFLIAVLDGYSRYVVYHEVRASMEGEDVTVVFQRAREQYPDEHPRVISDRGGQFIAREFKEFIRSAGLTQTLISTSYPQSNGKIERFYKTVKTECVRRSSLLSVPDARRVIAEYIEYYNTKRLHNALDYLTPLDILRGRRDELLRMREEKLERAKALRRKQYGQFSTLNQTPVLSDSR